MALTDYEKDWVSYVSGKKINAQSVADEATRNAAKDSFLTDVVLGQLDNVRAEIDAAQALIITRTEDANFITAAWRTITNSSAETTSDMKWRADDSDTNKGLLTNYELRSDVELDTIADIDERTKEIPKEDITALTQSFERIKELEKAMKMQFDDNGERLFSDEDIRNELWTPLVRSGLIPDNIVPDAYSEQAIAFKGAQELYAEKLEAFTATHKSSTENWKKGFKIAKASATVLGSIVSNSVTIGNATSVADANQDIKTMQEEDVVLKDERGNLPDPDPSGRRDEIDVKLGENKTDIDAKKVDVIKLNNQAKYIDLGTTILVGSLGVGEMIHDHITSDKDGDNVAKWAATIEKGITLAQGMAVKTVEMGIKANSSTGGKAEINMIKGVTCAMTAAFAGVKIIPKIVIATREADPDKMNKIIAGIIGDVADAVASSITAYSASINHGSSDAQEASAAAEQQQVSQYAAYLKIAIKECGNAPALIAAFKRGDFREVGMIALGTAFTIGFSVSADAVYNGIVQEQTTEEKLAHTKFQNNYFQTTDGTASGDQKMEKLEDKAINANLEKIAASMQKIDMSKFASVIQPENPAPPNLTAEELQAQITSEIENAEEEKAKEQLKTLLHSEEGAQAIMDDAEASIVGFEKMYQEAYPDSDITNRDPEVILRAQEAIDRAMANTNALRQKVALVNGISGGAVGILAALVPGTGAVVAVQKVLADIYALQKCVEVHNAWVKSMELTMLSQGGSSAAIQNILENATIHLAKASIDLILHTLKAGAEIAKTFDPTGASAITSASASMASAVVDFGFEMQKEAAIVIGWNAYKKARANPADRKAARKALRLNSTLAKCCIAYGASIMNDTAAKQAIKATGLSIAAMQDNKDICVRLISYLENELADDPVVLMVDYQKGVKWMPGTPSLDLMVWTSFKAACNKTAQPALADVCLKTPAIDRLLSLLAGTDLWTKPEEFEDAKERKATDDENVRSGIERPDQNEMTSKANEMAAELRKSSDYLDRLNSAFSAYHPLQAGDGGKIHDEMEPAAKTFATLARAGKKVSDANLAILLAYPVIASTPKVVPTP